MKTEPHSGKTPLPVLIAHRGHSRHAPENTIDAFQLAVASGATWIELDLQRSRDGELIVLHDATLQRTTNGSGYAERHSLSELSRLDAGSWFGAAWKHSTIPTLRQVLEALPASIHLNIEIKPRAARGPAGHALARRLHMLLDEFDRNQTVLVSSFAEHALLCIREFDNDISVGLLTHGRTHLGAVLNTLRTLDADWCIRNVLTTSRNTVQRLQAEGYRVGVYTANSVRALRHALHCGVDAIVTDDVVRSTAILEQLRQNG